MGKEIVFHLALTLMFILLWVVAALMPDKISGWLLMLTLPLNFCMLSGIICGELSAAAVSLTAPLLIWLILREEVSAAGLIRDALAALAGGLTAGIFCRIFKRTLVACMAGLLMSRIILGLSGFVFGILLKDNYILADFLQEGFAAVWPGLLCCLLLIPLLVTILKNTGLRYLLRREILNLD